MRGSGSGLLDRYPPRVRFVIPGLLALSLAACAVPKGTATGEPTSSAIATRTASSLDALPSAIPHELAPSLDPDLREELLAMLAEDQAVRTGIALPGDSRTAEELFDDLGNVDGRNSRRMAEILEENGWPGWSLVDEDGAEAAWALIQHADLRVELQEQGLAYLRGAVAARDASAGDLAYLIDRVLVAKDKPQVYGTQLGGDANGALVPRTPIEDEPNVDARRAAAGLQPLAEYMDEFRRSFESPADATSPSP
jgi:hypothetical protein